MTEEQRELMRIAAQRVVSDSALGISVDRFRLEWAQQIVRSIAPLGRPLGAGSPVLEGGLPVPLRGGVLEVF